MTSPRATLLRVLSEDLDRVRVTDPGGSWTAGALLAAAARIRPLLAGGDGPVGVACAAPGWVVASLLAAWSHGRRPILLDPSLRREVDALSLAHPGIVILADRGEEADGGRLRVDRLDVEDVRPAQAPPWLTVPGDEEPFTGFFTSGSEGAPKVVAKLGRQFFRQGAALAEQLVLPRGCRVLSFVPPFHLLGFFYGVFLPLALDGETTVASELTGAAMAELLAGARPTLAVGTATHYRLLARAPSPATGLSSTIFLSSGAPLDPTVAQAFAARHGRPVREIYGSTEIGGAAYRDWPAPYQPMPGVEWRADPATSRLEVRSPWAGAADGAAWVPTDDAVEVIDGGFRLLGRLSHMVKVGGKRFSSVEVEQALLSLPGVADAAVVPYERFGESAIGAVVALDPGAALSEEALRALLVGRIADFKLPRTIRIVAAIPRGSRTKVDFAALRRLIAGQDGPSD